jgi:hypothetical protein
MNETRRHGRIAAVLTSLIVICGALAAFAAAGDGSDARPNGAAVHEHAHGKAVQGARATSPAELALHDGMRKLWEDHVTWTRLAIISLTTGSPDTDATVGRLLRNQTDIGNAIKPFYGNAAGAQLTQLLREHILIAADLVGAAKAGDQAKVADATARWQANADQLAAFLNKANPHQWKLAELKTMLREHLRLTTNEALARLNGDWAADVAAYDQIHVQALGMSDMLSDGIVAQFPRRFH